MLCLCLYFSGKKKIMKKRRKSSVFFDLIIINWYLGRDGSPQRRN